ncbi:MAG: TcfC E-set like domain-containing protein [Proteobacteria bacterium]|nr:TcfC E-set like domain-containing protein [Pseudomonadota bacterium]
MNKIRSASLLIGALCTSTYANASIFDYVIKPIPPYNSNFLDHLIDNAHNANDINIKKNTTQPNQPMTVIEPVKKQEVTSNSKSIINLLKTLNTISTNDCGNNAPFLCQQQHNSTAKTLKNVVLLTSKAPVQQPTAPKKMSIAIDWHSVPAFFKKIILENGVKLDVYEAQKKITSLQFLIKDNLLRLNNPNDLTATLNLKNQAKKYLNNYLQQGIPLNTAVLCPADSTWCTPGKALFMYSGLSFDKSQSNIYLSPELFAIQRVKKKEGVLADSTVSNFANLFTYSGNFDYSNDDNNQNYYFQLNNTLSYKNSRLISQFYLGADNSTADLGVNGIMLQHDFSNVQLSAGYNNSMLFSGSALAFNYLPNASTLGFQLSSFNSRQLSTGVQSLTPITLYFNQISQIQVYKEGRLIYTQSYPMGMHDIDTTSFPMGIYPVTVKIYHGSQLISAKTYQINKPYSLQNLGDNSYQYTLMAGIASNNNFDNTFRLHDFNLPYLGGGYQQFITTITEAQLSGYVIDHLALGNIGVIMTPKEWLSINANAAADEGSGYNISTSANISYGFGSSAISFSAQHQSSDDLSPFSISQNIFNISQQLSPFDGTFGTLSLNYAYYTNSEMKNLTAMYSVNLYNQYNWLITLNLNYSYQLNNNTFSASYGNSTATDRSIALSISYNFSNGSYLQSNNQADIDAHNLSSTVNWGVADQDSWLNNLNGTIQRNTQSGDMAYTVGTTLKNEYVTGNVSATHNSGTIHDTTYTGSISGSVVNDFNTIDLDQNDDENTSGLMVHMNMPNTDNMLININNAEYRLHNGQNYIPLSPYKKYHYYLSESENDQNTLLYNREQRESILYPGNIEKVNFTASPETIVMGQLKSTKGDVNGDVIKNNVSQVSVDSYGYFIIPVSNITPTIEISYNGHNLKTINIAQKIAHPDKDAGAISLGEIYV